MGITIKEDEPDEGGEYVRVPLPRRNDGEIFAIADQLLGASKVKVMCADGKSRLARIPGKLKKRTWIKEGDLVIVKPWDFQDAKADVRYRYTHTQVIHLKKRKFLPKSMDVF